MAAKKEQHKEIMELGHDPKPGYKPAFLIFFSIGVLYLALVFLCSSPGVAGH